MVTLFEDLAYHFGRFGCFVKEKAGQVADLLRMAISWLLGTLKNAGDKIVHHGKATNDVLLDLLPVGARLILSGLGPAGESAPLVIAGSMVVVVFMIARRVIR